MLLQISVSNFSSYFGFFAALNLGYATSRSFRDAIDTEILKIGEKTLNDKIVNLQTQFNALISKAIKVSLEDLPQNKRKTEARFVDGFKSMFLITTFYCLTLLLLGGFQNPSVNAYYNNIINSLSTLIIIFNIFVFCRSYTKLYHQSIKPFITTVIFFITIILVSCANYIFYSSVSAGHYFSLEFMMSVASFIAISPYIMHFLKAFFHRMKFKPVEIDLIERYSEVIDDYNNQLKENLFPTVDEIIALVRAEYENKKDQK